MTLQKLFGAFLPLLFTGYAAATPVDESDIARPNDQVYETLPAEMLARIRAVTDVFGPVDGVTYEQAVDRYQRNADPEANLVIYEEMARAYKRFCASRCSTLQERLDVYRLVLLRTIYSSEETLLKVQLKVLSTAEAQAVVDGYKLEAVHITVVRE